MNPSLRNRCATAPLTVEPLEGRTLFSTAFLTYVAVHEFGHSLGLEHVPDNPNSIMYPYVNLNYDMANFASDPAVATLRAMYSDANVAAGTTPWKDSLDGNRDGIVSLTYSFVPDGTATDVGGVKNTLFATFNRLLGDPSVWKPHFANALAKWAGVSDGNITFAEHSDAGKRWGYVGKPQNDPYSGDIRIGAHARDGGGGVVAYAYYPTSGNKTHGGDVYFDDAEQWNYGLSPTPMPTTTTTTTTTNTTAPALSVGGGDVASPVSVRDDILTGRSKGIDPAFA